MQSAQHISECVLPLSRRLQDHATMACFSCCLFTSGIAGLMPKHVGLRTAFSIWQPDSCLHVCHTQAPAYSHCLYTHPHKQQCSFVPSCTIHFMHTITFHAVFHCSLLAIVFNSHLYCHNRVTIVAIVFITVIL